MLKYFAFVGKLKWPETLTFLPVNNPIVAPTKIPSAPSSKIYLKYFPIQTSKFLTPEPECDSVTAIRFRRQLFFDRGQYNAKIMEEKQAAEDGLNFDILKQFFAQKGQFFDP